MVFGTRLAERCRCPPETLAELNTSQDSFCSPEVTLLVSLMLVDSVAPVGLIPGVMWCATWCQGLGGQSLMQWGLWVQWDGRSLFA